MKLRMRRLRAASLFRTAFKPVIGAEVSGNVTLDEDTWWTKTGNWTIGNGVVSHTPAAQVDAVSHLTVLTAGKWYRFEYDVAWIAGSVWAGVGQPTGTVRGASGHIVESGRTASTSLAWYSNTAFNGAIDNLSCKMITLATMLKTVKRTPAGNVHAEANIQCIKGNQVGIAVNIDSPSNPQNMVICYTDGTKIYLDKLVGGTWTNVLNSAITYAAGKKIKITKSGTTYKVFYGGAQVGEDQAISDAGVVNNTLHMQFSSYERNRFGSFMVKAN